MPGNGPAPRWWRGLALGLGIMLGTEAMAEAPSPLAHAHLASSERLRLRAMGLALDQGQLGLQGRAAMRREMERQGFYHDGTTPRLIERRIGLAPVLAHDGNINGGVLNDRLSIGGIIFEADPAWRARSGLVLGATVSGRARLGWSSGRHLELTGVLEAAWSPRHDIGRKDAMLGLCSKNHLQGWTFLDLCASANRSWRQLDINEATRISLGTSRIITLPSGSLHELGLRLDQVRASDYRQPRLALRVESLWPAGVSAIGVTFGRGVEDETVLRRRLDLSLARHAMGRDWTLDAWWQEAAGGRFLGAARRDIGQGLGLETELRPGVAARVWMGRNRSNAQIARYNQVGLELRLSRW